MKRIVLFILLIAAIGNITTAQTVATYRATAVRFTFDEDWSTAISANIEDQSVFIVYNTYENEIKISNERQDRFFIRDINLLDDDVDEDGDTLKNLGLKCWDEKGDDCQLLFQYWKGLDFSDGTDMHIKIIREDIWYQYN